MSSSERFLDQLEGSLKQSESSSKSGWDQPAAPAHQQQGQGQQTGSAAQGATEWTPEQIQQYYQYYGYNYDYSQYYGQQAQQQHQPQPEAHAGGGADGQGYGGYDNYGGGYGSAYYGPGPGYGGQRGGPGGGQEPGRILWLGNVHPDTTEQEIQNAFGRFGMLEGVKLITQKNCAFVRFYEVENATKAYQAMARCSFHGQPAKVGWGKSDPADAKKDDGPAPSRNIWVGNIPPGVSEETIRNVFIRFGNIERVKVLDMKNCAFVDFSTLEAAINAKRSMQGALIQGSPVKINFGKGVAASSSAMPAPVAEAPPPPVPQAPLPPPPTPPPAEAEAPEDKETQGVIDKLVEFVARNGRSFEKVMVEKQKDNPKFGFLQEGHPQHPYYEWKLWQQRHPGLTPEQARALNIAAEIEPSSPSTRSPAAPYGAVPPPMSLQQGVQVRQAPGLLPSPAAHPSFNQQAQSFHQPPPPAFQPPPPADELTELKHMLERLEPTKDSIKTAKGWIVNHQNKAREISEILSNRVGQLRDFDSKLNVVYLIHDVLHHSARGRNPGEIADPFSAALSRVLPEILRRTFEEANGNQENEEKLQKVVRLWVDKNIYDSRTVSDFETEMKRRTERKRRGFDDDYERDRERDRDRGEKRRH